MFFLKKPSLVIIILVFSSALLLALALQCSRMALLFLAGLFVSSCCIFYQYDHR